MSRRHGPTRSSRPSCSRTPRPRALSSASVACRARTWSSSRTPTPCTTSSPARSARATRGRCSGCPPNWYKDPAYRSRIVRRRGARSPGRTTTLAGGTGDGARRQRGPVRRSPRRAHEGGARLAQDRQPPRGAPQTRRDRPSPLTGVLGGRSARGIHIATMAEGASPIARTLRPRSRPAPAVRRVGRHPGCPRHRPAAPTGDRSLTPSPAR